MLGGDAGRTARKLREHYQQLHNCHDRMLFDSVGLCVSFLGRAKSCRWKWGILTRRLRSCRFYDWFLWVDLLYNIISYWYSPTYPFLHTYIFIIHIIHHLFFRGLCQNQSMNLMAKATCFFFSLKKTRGKEDVKLEMLEGKETLVIRAFRAFQTGEQATWWGLGGCLAV